jgi:hypothetical protein
MSKELEKAIADPDLAAKLDMAVEHKNQKKLKKLCTFSAVWLKLLVRSRSQ